MKLVRLVALVTVVTVSITGTALASSGSPAPQLPKDCRRVQERLRAHGSGGRTTLCATQTRTPLETTDSKAPRGGTGTSDSGHVSAQGLRPDSTASAVPAYCPTAYNQLNNAGRVGSCAKSRVALVQFDSRGRVLGEAAYAATYWAQLTPRARSWNYNVKLGSFRGIGTLASGVYATAFGHCLGGCRINAAYPPDGSEARLGPGAPVQGRWAMSSPGTRTLLHRFNADIVASLPGATNEAGTSLNYLATARCDSAAYLQSSGCVYPVNPGVFRLSAAPGSEVTEAAAFYRDAQASLANHAGRFDGPPLRRTRDAATIRANRARLSGGALPSSAARWPVARTATNIPSPRPGLPPARSGSSPYQAGRTNWWEVV